MRELGQREIRSIQCEMMQNLHEFMLENRLKYSLACGTLIGAVRHSGYIPWDDDIDIYMPREDYKKLISLFPETYNMHYKLVAFERSPRWCRAYANIYDDRTIWNEEKTREEIIVGVNIDIFPVDNVPDDEKELKKYIRKKKILTYLWAAKHTTNRWTNRSIPKNLSVLMMKFLLIPVSIHYIVKCINKFVQRSNAIESSKIWGILGGVIEKNPFKKEDFDETLLMSFEQYDFCVMKGYDDCLKNSYGDYMKLPPERERKSHHYYQAFLKD